MYKYIYPRKPIYSNQPNHPNSRQMKSFRNTMPTRQLQSFQQQFYRTVTTQDQLIKTSVGHWQGIFRHVTRCQRERRIETSLTMVYTVWNK